MSNEIIIKTNNPAAVSCDCLKCKWRLLIGIAMAAKIDKEIMKEINVR